MLKYEDYENASRFSWGSNDIDMTDDDTVYKVKREVSRMVEELTRLNNLVRAYRLTLKDSINND